MPAQVANPEIAATYSEILSSACQKVPLPDAPFHGRVTKVSVTSHTSLVSFSSADTFPSFMLSMHAVLQVCVDIATTACCCTCSFLQGADWVWVTVIQVSEESADLYCWAFACMDGGARKQHAVFKMLFNACCSMSWYVLFLKSKFVLYADKIMNTVQIGSSFKASPQDTAGTDASSKISVVAASSTAATRLSAIKAAADNTDRAAADSQLSNDESAIQVRIPHTHHVLLHCHPWSSCQEA